MLGIYGPKKTVVEEKPSIERDLSNPLDTIDNLATSVICKKDTICINNPSLCVAMCSVKSGRLDGLEIYI